MTDILFPARSANIREVDSCFEAEFKAAKAVGFNCYLLDFDTLDRWDAKASVRALPDHAGPLLYRGWMLTSAKYATLEGALFSRLRNTGLITSGVAYS